MGMYTQIHFASNLKKDVPEEVVDVLKYIAGDGKEPEKLPDHQLFQTCRWGILMTCDSYYFNYKTSSKFFFDDISNQWNLSFTANLKNYDSEIEKFINWINPYLDKFDGEFLGYSRYEEIEQPTLIFK